MHKIITWLMKLLTRRPCRSSPGADYRSVRGEPHISEISLAVSLIAFLVQGPGPARADDAGLPSVARCATPGATAYDDAKTGEK